MDKQEIKLKVEQGNLIFFADESGYVTTIIAQGMDNDETDKLAEDMVDAFNSHPALVEDKKTLAEALEKIIDLSVLGSDTETAVDVARAALALIKEGE